jgi:hypothetical protein
MLHGSEDTDGGVDDRVGAVGEEAVSGDGTGRKDGPAPT